MRRHGGLLAWLLWPLCPDPRRHSRVCQAWNQLASRGQ
jgi:hypothetical protein